MPQPLILQFFRKNIFFGEARCLPIAFFIGTGKVGFVATLFLCLLFVPAAGAATQPTDATAEVSAAEASGVQPASAASVEVRELWTGSLYASRFRVGICFSSLGGARGVLLLRVPGGKVDVYHITGSVDGHTVEAAHQSGHTFKGQLVASDKVEGVITLKNGMKFSLEGVRTQDAALTEECGPLPESE